MSKLTDWFTKCPECRGNDRNQGGCINCQGREGCAVNCFCGGDGKAHWKRRIRWTLSKPLLGFCPTCNWPDRFMGVWLDSVPLLGRLVDWLHRDCADTIPF